MPIRTPIANGWTLLMFRHALGDHPDYSSKPIACNLQRVIGGKLFMIGWYSATLETGLREAKEKAK